MLPVRGLSESLTFPPGNPDVFFQIAHNFIYHAISSSLPIHTAKGRVPGSHDAYPNPTTPCLSLFLSNNSTSSDHLLGHNPMPPRITVYPFHKWLFPSATANFLEAVDPAIKSNSLENQNS